MDAGGSGITSTKFVRCVAVQKFTQNSPAPEVGGIRQGVIMYQIHWKSLLTGATGHGVRMYTKDDAEKQVEQLNKDFAGVAVHSAIDVDVCPIYGVRHKFVVIGYPTSRYMIECECGEKR